MRDTYRNEKVPSAYEFGELSESTTPMKIEARLSTHLSFISH